MSINLIEIMVSSGKLNNINSIPLTIVKQTASTQGYGFCQRVLLQNQQENCSAEGAIAREDFFVDENQVCTTESNDPKHKDEKDSEKDYKNSDSYEEQEKDQDEGEQRSHEEEEQQDGLNVWGNIGLEDERHYISDGGQSDQSSYSDEAESEQDNEMDSEYGSNQATEQDESDYDPNQSEQDYQEQSDLETDGLSEIEEESNQSDCDLPDNRLIVILPTQQLMRY